MTPEEARKALAARGADTRRAPTRTGQNPQGGSAGTGASPQAMLDALKAIPQDEASIKARKSKLAKTKGMTMPQDTEELLNYVRAAGRGHVLGDDTFDTLGSGIATAFALPGAISRKRSAGAAPPKEGLMSYIDDALELAPEVYGDIKGTVDMEERMFEEDNPYAADKLGNVGDVLQAYGGLKAGLPMAKSAFKTAWKPTGGALWKLGNKVIDESVGGLSKAVMKGFK